MPKMPDNPVAQVQPAILEQAVIIDVEGKDLSVFNIIAHLPAQTAPIHQDSDEFIYHGPLLVQIRLNALARLVSFADVIRR